MFNFIKHLANKIVAYIEGVEIFYTYFLLFLEQKIGLLTYST
jgi:hypothetical protein